MKIKTTFSVVSRVFAWVVMLVVGAVYSIYHDINKEIFHSIVFHIFTAIVGYFIIKLSFKAAAKGGKELSKYGRDKDTPRLETNKLVTTGIYSCVRHPMLYGLTILPLGVALLIGSPTFILFIAPVEMFFILFMILTFEELEVKRKFGDEYEKYKKQVPILTLKKECLKKLFK